MSKSKSPAATLKEFSETMQELQEALDELERLLANYVDNLKNKTPPPTKDLN